MCFCDLNYFFVEMVKYFLCFLVLFLVMYVCNDDGVFLYEYLFFLWICIVRVKYGSFNLNVFVIKEFSYKLKIDINVLDKICN